MTNDIDTKPNCEIEEMTREIIDQLEDQGRLPLEFSTLKFGPQVSTSSQISDRVQGRSLQTLNDGELKSVYALLAYVSHNENIRQETVQAIVEARFGVNHVARIQQKDYDEVIHFLVDLRIDEMRN